MDNSAMESRITIAQDDFDRANSILSEYLAGIKEYRKTGVAPSDETQFSKLLQAYNLFSISRGYTRGVIRAKKLNRQSADAQEFLEGVLAAEFRMRLYDPELDDNEIEPTIMRLNKYMALGKWQFYDGKDTAVEAEPSKTKTLIETGLSALVKGEPLDAILHPDKIAEAYEELRSRQDTPIEEFLYLHSVLEDIATNIAKDR